ncbi:STAS domain-containing protein [Litchfieldella xinjiangensis]|uniref:STAS domain-containing protein n=1 Tax=Litchfieldella xinjiangensis TaxID=1166948 RepID=UPI0005B9D1D5|nr:STAS domain-containing protein [Halomonas xinjiangensis]
MTPLFSRPDTRLEAGDAVLRITGEVDFDVAAPLAASGRQWLSAVAPGQTVSFDLSGVDRVSSAALSVLLDWTRCSHAAELNVEKVVLSPALARLTAVADLDSLLPIETV